MLSEAKIQEHAVELLRAYARHDIEWHHVPNGEKRDKRTAKRLKRMGVQPGVADLLLLISGGSYAVELKTETGRQSKAQAGFQERFERAGGKYFLARGMTETINTLSRIGAFRIAIKITDASDERRVRRESARRKRRSPTIFREDGARA
jgi:hypothetical protein